ncbi:MAG: dimethyl sulfoxide reductase anchor subunit [Coriobacteriales bacterium]|jgi:anaerobic dimethyl sulfoxide reductase subunit C (anchor subunit)|nr:dimethyl sulfoxide reductase anchor subunit [Coriobacteriales bacterium]
MEIQWPLIFFTLLSTLAGGLFAGQGILVLMGKGRPIHFPALVVEVAAIAIGGFSAFLHLQHWERIFNGFGQLRSGITHELVGLAIFAVSIVIFFLVFRRAKGKEALPKWLGVFALIIGLFVIYVTAASYDMSARPAWHTPLLYVYYYATGFVLGAAGLWFLSGITKAEDTYVGLAKATAIGGLVSLVAVVVYGFVIANTQYSDVGLYFFDPTDSTAPHPDQNAVTASILTGGNALLFWAGSVFLGSVVAGVLGLFSWLRAKEPVGNPWSLAAIALVSALGGGVFFRVVFYIVGATIWPFFTQ